VRSLDTTLKFVFADYEAGKSADHFIGSIVTTIKELMRSMMEKVGHAQVFFLIIALDVIYIKE